uniref:Major intrinsic family protein n=1 Tax=Zygnema circumcarinatum TaxID=35869 RepID=A0A6M3SL83_ZYGCR|nr:major intrinsic family protein [Zygnema circumcarinatum]
MASDYGKLFVAEFVGTFLLVLLGNGAICNTLLPGTKGHGFGFLGIAAGFAFGVFIPLQMVGHISEQRKDSSCGFRMLKGWENSYFNPAVSLGGAVIGHISWVKMLLCWAAEMSGAIVAGFLLFITYLPHFQDLELIGDDEKPDCLCCNSEDAKVAVLRHEIKGSSKRFASTKNLKSGKGKLVKPEKNANDVGPVKQLLERLNVLDPEKMEDHSKSMQKVVISSDIKDLKVKHLVDACGPNLGQSIEEHQEVKLVVFCTRPSTVHLFWLFSTWAEFFGTALLTFCAFAFGNTAKSSITDAATLHLYTRGLEPLLVGLLVGGLILALGGVTGPALNPARDLGPRIVHWLMPIPGKGSSEWWYAWVPVVGPMAGGVVGALLADQLKELT